MESLQTYKKKKKNALVRASNLPLSILVVGVGGADFTQMEVYSCFPNIMAF